MSLCCIICNRSHKHPRKASNKPRENVLGVLFHGLKNYRGWILGLAYDYCFDVELTVDNIIAQYFYDRLGLTQDNMRPNTIIKNKASYNI